MRHLSICGRLFLLGALFIVRQVQANDLYVATNGTPSGPGTMTQPYDLTTAFSGAVGHPGDTFWLAGGNYVIGHLNTRIQGAAGQPVTFRPRPGESARVDGSLTFFDSTGYVVLRDLEFYSSDTNRVSSETNIVNLTPTDIPQFSGISSYSPNMEFINLVVHDEPREGIYIPQAAYNNLIYGCVIFNNGWRSPDNAEGHGIYMQGWNGGREVADNIVFNNSGVGLHIYENQSGYYLGLITLDGNVAFNAGAIQNVRPYRDWIVGVDAPALYADQIVFENNLGYFSSTPGLDDSAQIGRQGINGGVAILNNYLPQGLQMNNWTIAAVSGNTLSAQPGHYSVNLNQSGVQLAAAWNNNTYVVPTNSGGFWYDANPFAFTNWQNATEYDANSSYLTGDLSGTRVFVRPNLLEAGRANIIVYNWSHQTNVPVDVSSVLAAGAPYAVYNAENFLAPPVLSGVFDGHPLNLPMQGLTVAVPNGPMITPPPTGPTFNVFVLMPRQVKMDVSAAGGQVIVSWPTNAGDWVLQTTPDLAAGAWADDTNAVLAVVGDQDMATNPILADAQFYRLRPAP